MQIQFWFCWILHLPSPNSEKQDGSSPPTSKAERSQDAHTIWYQHNSVLSATFETRPDQGNSTSLQYRWSLSFLSLRYIYNAYSNPFLKLLFCILAIHFRKTGPNWKPVCCLDSLRKLKGTKNYMNWHPDHETNWWFHSAFCQAIVHFSCFLLFSYYCAHHKKCSPKEDRQASPIMGGQPRATKDWLRCELPLPFSFLQTDHTQCRG